MSWAAPFASGWRAGDPSSKSQHSEGRFNSQWLLRQVADTSDKPYSGKVKSRYLLLPQRMSFRTVRPAPPHEGSNALRSPVPRVLPTRFTRSPAFVILTSCQRTRRRCLPHSHTPRRVPNRVHTPPTYSALPYSAPAYPAYSLRSPPLPTLAPLHSQSPPTPCGRTPSTAPTTGRCASTWSPAGAT